mmetsp:Transcript_8051/g.20310  ORF Transcript_8051/g.20310 Transcript_8051/m.20310 type:complete len:245 (+) Transcript_8051:498-1232(+)
MLDELERLVLVLEVRVHFQIPLEGLDVRLELLVTPHGLGSQRRHPWGVQRPSLLAIDEGIPSGRTDGVHVEFRARTPRAYQNPAVHWPDVIVQVVQQIVLEVGGHLIHTPHFGVSFDKPFVKQVQRVVVALLFHVLHVVAELHAHPLACAHVVLRHLEQLVAVLGLESLKVPIVPRPGFGPPAYHHRQVLLLEVLVELIHTQLRGVHARNTFLVQQVPPLQVALAAVVPSVDEGRIKSCHMAGT